MRILVGVTGGIAAYKAAGVIRGFTELGHTVKVLPTQNALRFIGATTLEALSHNTIDPDLYTDVDSVKHIALAQEADLVVVAPATAAFLARYAAGLADDLLLNVLLATRAPVVVSPAMHEEMWMHPATIANVNTLRARGVAIIEPAVGRLTGADSGAGRLPEPHEIVTKALASFSNQDLIGQRVTIATGGTREAIDEVRFIGNRSSGKQGIALADAAVSRGATVTLVAINIDLDLSRFADVKKVSTTTELQQELMKSLATSHVVFMPAAVSDFRLVTPFPGKISRTESTKLSLELVANSDVLAGLSEQRKLIESKALLVGFAAEVLDPSDGELELSQRALSKLKKKNVDMVVANDVSNGKVFDGDNNEVTIVTRSGSVRAQGSKLEVAHSILDEVIHLLN